MGAKIMVVEDESIVALNLQRCLIRLGYDVPCIAASHDQALRGVAEKNPDLVLMDINISGDKDGIQTAADINVPVIYLSAYSEEHTLDRAKSTKPYGFLVKPFSDRELHATIKMALERNKFEKQLASNEYHLAQAYARLEEDKNELEIKTEELYSEKERLLVTLESIGDAVISTDKSGNVEYLNPVAENMTGWKLDLAKGMPLSQVLVLLDPITQQAVRYSQEGLLQISKTSIQVLNHVLLGKSGVAYPVESSAALIRDRNSNVIGSVMVFHDVSVTRRLTEEMTYLATHDALTGLINRREFEVRLEKAIVNAEQLSQQHVLAYLDLDQFKIVNDTCGHVAGDELLRKITGLLKLELRANDILARLGGDEFGVLLESCPQAVAMHIAEALRNVVHNFHFVWEDKTFPISVSIGLVSFGSKELEVMSLDDLLSTADSACYTAKDTGRNRIHVYHQDDIAMNKRIGEMTWHSRIFKALELNSFVLYAQKIEQLKGEGIYSEHVEILVRLTGEDGSLIPPMAFIPAAERYGLMTAIDRWVVRNAFEHIAKLPDQNTSLFAINLSGSTVNDAESLNFITDQLLLSQIRPSSVCFEITETTAIVNLLNASAFISALRKMGCKFALDDFGSGMSSFSYLKHLPVDFLKIDGAFVKEIAVNDIDSTFVVAINNIAHVMGMQTIAEFAENDEILKQLREFGVDYAQGYGVGIPVPLKGK